ncbi:MAG: PAS domain-containing sensor histidine kinase [Campylobacterales bacterium]|nr:PAS domain-containing sensor histidine kinase [Campylobacterales bacterium]
MKFLTNFFYFFSKYKVAEEKLYNKNLELELKTKKLNFIENLLNDFHDLVLFVNLDDWSILYANNIFFEKSGYTKDEIENKKIYDIQSFFKKENNLENIKSTIKNSKKLLIDNYLITKNFEHIPTEDTFTYNNDFDKEYLIIFSKDVSKFKKNEIKLIEQKEFLELIFEQSPNLIFVKDCHGVYKFANSVFCESFDIKLDKLIGNDDSAIFNDPKEIIKFQALDQKVLEAGETKFFPVVQAVINSEKNIVKYYQTVLITLNKNKPLTERLLLGISNDITELKQVQDELNILNQNLENRVKIEIEKNRQNEHILIQQSKMALIGELMNNIAHHWRQPLNIISIGLDDIYDQFIHDNISKDDFVSVYNTVHISLKTLSNTIDGFRTFFKSSNQKESFNILNNLELLKSIVIEQLKNKNIEYELNSMLKNSNFFSYKSELNQVLLNLIHNSIEAIENNRKKVGSYTGFVKITLHEDNEFLYIDVIDNGGGIKNEIIDKIFEPYFTTKFQSTGTGLGLYICKNIIEHLFFGTIIATNENDGAKVSITIKNSKLAI